MQKHANTAEIYSTQLKNTRTDLAIEANRDNLMVNTPNAQAKNTTKKILLALDWSNWTNRALLG